MVGCNVWLELSIIWWYWGDWNYDSLEIMRLVVGMSLDYDEEEDDMGGVGGEEIVVDML